MKSSFFQPHLLLNWVGTYVVCVGALVWVSCKKKKNLPHHSIHSCIKWDTAIKQEKYNLNMSGRQIPDFLLCGATNTCNKAYHVIFNSFRNYAWSSNPSLRSYTVTWSHANDYTTQPHYPTHSSKRPPSVAQCFIHTSSRNIAMGLTIEQHTNPVKFFMTKILQKKKKSNCSLMQSLNFESTKKTFSSNFLAGKKKSTSRTVLPG